MLGQSFPTQSNSALNLQRPVKALWDQLIKGNNQIHGMGHLHVVKATELRLNTDKATVGDHLCAAGCFWVGGRGAERRRPGAGPSEGTRVPVRWTCGRRPAAPSGRRRTRWRAPRGGASCWPSSRVPCRTPGAGMCSLWRGEGVNRQTPVQTVYSHTPLYTAPALAIWSLHAPLPSSPVSSDWSARQLCHDWSNAYRLIQSAQELVNICPNKVGPKKPLVNRTLQWSVVLMWPSYISRSN